MASKQFCSIRDLLTNSCEWTLSRSPLEVVSYHWNLDRVFLINSRVLSKILGMLPYLSLVALEKKKQKMNWVLQLSFVQLFPCSWCYWFYLPLFLWPLLNNYFNLIHYSYASIISRYLYTQTVVDILVYVSGLWRLWFLQWGFLIWIFLYGCRSSHSLHVSSLS